MLGWVDRNAWSVPVAVFVGTCALSLLGRPVFGAAVSFTSGPVRQQFYASLTGSSSALLGFLIASVTILAAFGKRPTTTAAEQRREEALADARTRLVVLLLFAAFFMLIVLVTASIAIAASSTPQRLYIADTVIVGASAAGISGLVYGAIGLGLAVAERGM